MPYDDYQIKGEEVNDTVIFDGKDIRSKEMRIPLPVYPLERGEFYILKEEPSGPKKWAKNFFWALAAFIVLVLGKVVYFLWKWSRATSPEELSNLETGISPYESVSILILLICIIVFYGIGKLHESERDKVINRISKKLNKTNER